MGVSSRQKYYHNKQHDPKDYQEQAKLPTKHSIKVENRLLRENEREGSPVHVAPACAGPTTLGLM
jgi:hypothetical protein